MATTKQAAGGAADWQRPSDDTETFPVWSVTREDIAMTFMDEDDSEASWADELSDAQMEAVAGRMQHYLHYSMEAYWEALREAVDYVVPRASADGEGVV